MSVIIDVDAEELPHFLSHDQIPWTRDEWLERIRRGISTENDMDNGEKGPRTEDVARKEFAIAIELLGSDTARFREGFQAVQFGDNITVETTRLINKMHQLIPAYVLSFADNAPFEVTAIKSLIRFLVDTNVRIQQKPRTVAVLKDIEEALRDYIGFVHREPAIMNVSPATVLSTIGDMSLSAIARATVQSTSLPEFVRYRRYIQSFVHISEQEANQMFCWLLHFFVVCDQTMISSKPAVDMLEHMLKSLSQAPLFKECPTIVDFLSSFIKTTAKLFKWGVQNGKKIQAAFPTRNPDMVRELAMYVVGEFNAYAKEFKHAPIALSVGDIQQSLRVIEGDMKAIIAKAERIETFPVQFLSTMKHYSNAFMHLSNEFGGVTNPFPFVAGMPREEVIPTQAEAGPVEAGPVEDDEDDEEIEEYVEYGEGERVDYKIRGEAQVGDIFALTRDAEGVVVDYMIKNRAGDNARIPRADVIGKYKGKGRWVPTAPRVGPIDIGDMVVYNKKKGVVIETNTECLYVLRAEALYSDPVYGYFPVSEIEPQVPGAEIKHATKVKWGSHKTGTVQGDVKFKGYRVETKKKGGTGVDIFPVEGTVRVVHARGQKRPRD